MQRDREDSLVLRPPSWIWRAWFPLPCHAPEPSCASRVRLLGKGRSSCPSAYPMPWFLVSLWSFSESPQFHHLMVVLEYFHRRGCSRPAVRGDDLLPTVCHSQIFPTFCILHTGFLRDPAQPVWKLVWRSSFTKQLLLDQQHQLPTCASRGHTDHPTSVIYPFILITHLMSNGCAFWWWSFFHLKCIIWTEDLESRLSQNYFHLLRVFFCSYL